MNVYSVNLHGFMTGDGFMTGWQEKVAEMDPSHRLMLEGGGLSGIFLRYPLKLVNPLFVGGFYGILISTALLPMGIIFGESSNWIGQSLKLLALTSLLRGFSLGISSIIKRPPIRLENRRRYLFPIPFLGLLILVIEAFFGLGENTSRFGLFLLIVPGPIYVQLSYAPRWRILNRIQNGRGAFDGMVVTIYSDATEDEEVVDREMEEAIGGSLGTVTFDLDDSFSD